MPGEFSDAFPSIGFPLNGAVTTIKAPCAIARMLRLAVGFNFFQIACHGNQRSEARASLKEQYSEKGAGNSPCNKA